MFFQDRNVKAFQDRIRLSPLDFGSNFTQKTGERNKKGLAMK